MGEWAKWHLKQIPLKLSCVVSFWNTTIKSVAWPHTGTLASRKHFRNSKFCLIAITLFLALYAIFCILSLAFIWSYTWTGKGEDFADIKHHSDYILNSKYIHESDFLLLLIRIYLSCLFQFLNMAKQLFNSLKQNPKLKCFVLENSMESIRDKQCSHIWGYKIFHFYTRQKLHVKILANTCLYMSLANTVDNR